MLVLSRRPGEAISVGHPSGVEGRWLVASSVRTTGTNPSGDTAGPASCQAAPPPGRPPRGSSPSRPGSRLGRTAGRGA
jgi:hypothetical protein